MHIITFIIWIIALVLFMVVAVRERQGGWNLMALGLFAFTLAVGLQFLIETGDRITLSW